MAKHSNIVPFFLKWEGGLSRSTKDTASANPAPWTYNGLTGWHTNKGVTYSTFKSMAPAVGYSVTADNFFTMPSNIWGGIMKIGYWDPFKLDEMNSQVIADTIVSWAWGSGVTGAATQLKKFLAKKGITVTSTSDIVNAFNSLVTISNEEQIFTEMVAAREAYFRAINQPANLQGWLNRLAEFKSFGLETIKKKSS